MKKLISLIITLTVILSILVVAPADSLADVKIYGETSRSVSFKVKANSDNAYFVLSSSTGLANVAQHNWHGGYTGDGNEATHGFYWIQYGKSGENRTRTSVWAPDATTNTSGIDTCKEIRFTLPTKGTYTFTIAPMSTGEAAKYWRTDSINYWVYNATWALTITSGCTVETW